MRRLQVGLVAFFLNGCGSPIVPTGPSPVPTTSNPSVNPVLTITAFGPFHVGEPGTIQYTVTDVSTLASVAYLSTDGSLEAGAVMSPAPAVGTMHLTYTRVGRVTVTLTATLSSGASLHATMAVDVVE